VVIRGTAAQTIPTNMKRSKPPRRHTRISVPVGQPSPLSVWQSQWYNRFAHPTDSRKPLFYLASPISTSDPLQLWGRYESASMALARLITAGYLCYSPMTHWMSAVATWHLPMDWKFWEPISLGFLRRCDALIILRLDGWEQSTGMKAEISWAKDHDLPVFALTHSADPALATVVSEGYRG
jgi:hypothetical protein